MILADKIIDLRKKNGWSQEELAEMLGVSRQAVSKWEGAQSVPDMARVVQMSELFGVTTDYLLKDALEREETIPVTERVFGTARTVGMEEANSYLSTQETNAKRISIGVMMCILCSVLLILLAGAQEFGLIPMTEEQASGIGLVVLFLLIAGGVALFIISGLDGNRFEYLEKEPIDTLYGVDGMVREKKERFRPTFNLYLTLGIVLCVLAVVPLFGCMVFASEESFLYIVATGLLLVLIAVGVKMIVWSSIIWGSYKVLLEEGDYTREEKEKAKEHGYFGAIYWGLATTVYMAWSFITQDWSRSWIVWPIAGVAYGAVFGIVGALGKKQKTN